MHVSDEELVRQALAADPDAPLPDEAVSLWSLDSPRATILPSWYMPAPTPGARRLTRHRRRVAYLLVSTFVLINAAGLCSTYGFVVIA